MTQMVAMEGGEWNHMYFTVRNKNLANSTQKHEGRKKRLIFISKTTPGGRGEELLEHPEMW